MDQTARKEGGSMTKMTDVTEIRDDVSADNGVQSSKLQTMQSLDELNSLKSQLGKTWSELSNIMNKYHAQVIETREQLEITSLGADSSRILKLERDSKTLRTENRQLLKQIVVNKADIMKLRTENRTMRDEVTMKDTLIEKIQNQMAQEALDYQAELASLKEILEARSRGAELTATLIASPDTQPAKRRKVSLQQLPARSVVTALAKRADVIPARTDVTPVRLDVAAPGLDVTPVISNVSAAQADVFSMSASSTPVLDAPSTSSVKNESFRKASASQIPDSEQSATEDSTSQDDGGFVKLNEVGDESNLEDLEGLVSEQEEYVQGEASALTDGLESGQEQMTEYYVVNFTEDNSVAIVSEHWRAILDKPKKNGEKCSFYWPPTDIANKTTKMKKALEGRAVHYGEGKWSGPFDARVLHISENYLEAVQELTKARFSSDLEYEVEQGRRKRKKLRKRQSSSSSEEYLSSSFKRPPRSPSPPHPPPSPYRNQPKFHSLAERTRSRGSGRLLDREQGNSEKDTGRISRPPVRHEPSGHSHEKDVGRISRPPVQDEPTSRQHTRFEQETLRYLTTINAKVDSAILKLNGVVATVKSIKLIMDPATASDGEEELELPCTTVTSLEDLNGRLSTKANMDKMVLRMLVHRGVTAKDTTYAVLAAILEHQLSLGYTRTGAGKTRSLQAITFVYKLVQNVVRRVHAKSPLTNSDIDGYISRWFGARKDRSGGRAKRTKPKSREHDDSDGEDPPGAGDDQTSS